MATSKIVDSWALIAWLLDQDPASTVEMFLEEANAGNLDLQMSWINVGKVYYITLRRYGRNRAAGLIERLPPLPSRLILPDEGGILAAAEIKAVHRVSYSDAFAISLARSQNGSVITGDDEIRRCGVVPVDWIGT
jgi:predicted nucleic acid-binding protein